LAGEARVYLHDESGHEITLRTLRGGHILGEFSTLDRKPHAASVAALTDLDVLELNRRDFLNLLRERPLVGMELMRGFAERIRYATSYLERLHDAIELLANNEYDEAIREMALTADEDEMQELISSFLALVHHVQARGDDTKK
jgi:CRP-like cAMP-binding protein